MEENATTFKTILDAAVKTAKVGYAGNYRKYFVQALDYRAEDYFKKRPDPSIPLAAIQNVQFAHKIKDISKIVLKLYVSVNYGAVTARRVVEVSKVFTVSSDASTKQINKTVKAFIDDAIPKMVNSFYDGLPHYYPGSITESFKKVFESVTENAPAPGKKTDAVPSAASNPAPALSKTSKLPSLNFLAKNVWEGFGDKIRDTILNTAKSIFQSKTMDIKKPFQDCVFAKVTDCILEPPRVSKDTKIYASFTLVFSWDKEYRHSFRTGITVEDYSERTKTYDDAEKYILETVQDACCAAVREKLTTFPAAYIPLTGNFNGFLKLLVDAVRHGALNTGTNNICIHDDRLQPFSDTTNSFLCYLGQNKFCVCKETDNFHDHRQAFVLNQMVLEKENVLRSDILSPDLDSGDFLPVYFFAQDIADISADIASSQDLPEPVITIEVSAGKISELRCCDISLPCSEFLQRGNPNWTGVRDFISKCFERQAKLFEVFDEQLKALNGLNISEMLILKSIAEHRSNGEFFDQDFVSEDFHKECLQHLCQMRLRDLRGEFSLISCHVEREGRNAMSVTVHTLNPRLFTPLLERAAPRQYSSEELKHIRPDRLGAWLTYSARTFTSPEDLWPVLRFLFEVPVGFAALPFLKSVEGELFLRKLQGSDAEYARLMLEQMPEGSQIIQRVWGRGELEEVVNPIALSNAFDSWLKQQKSARPATPQR